MDTSSKIKNTKICCFTGLGWKKQDIKSRHFQVTLTDVNGRISKTTDT